MSELADLARTAGAEVVGSDVQRRAEVDPAHFIGMGKVESLRDMKLEGAFDLVICNPPVHDGDDILACLRSGHLFAFPAIAAKTEGGFPVCT